MKVTKTYLRKQIKLIEKTQTICNDIISLKYTLPQKRDTLLKNILLKSKPLKRDIKLLQESSIKERKKEQTKLKRRFVALEKLCTKLHINMNDKNGEPLDIYKLKTRVNQKKSYLLKKDPFYGLKNLDKDYFPLINQVTLSKRLGLSNSVIQYLKDTGVLKWENVRGKVYFSNSSIKKFQNSFNIKDYITIAEAKKTLEHHGFYDEFYQKMSITKFGFSITVIQLIETDRTEYKLESVKFGSTIFITKESMSLCIENLKKLEEKNMIYLEQMEKILQKKKKIYSLSRKRKRLHSLRHPK